MIYGIIYKILNLKNGKVYIGQTTRTLKERIGEHISIAKRNGDYMPIISKAILKHGENNFSYDVIDYAYDLSDLNMKEAYWIGYFNSYIGNKDSNGYNMTTGGDGTPKRIVTEETKKKIKRTQSKMDKSIFGRKGELNHMFGKTGDKSPMFGMSGALSPTSIPVVRLSLKGEFIERYDSASDGAKSIDSTNGSGITKCCNGKSRKHKGFIWLYEKDYNTNVINDKLKELSRGKKGREVVQLTIDGEFIRLYNTIKDAEIDIVGKPMGAIVKCCNGKSKTYKGFKWVYADEYEG